MTPYLKTWADEHAGNMLLALTKGEIRWKELDITFDNALLRLFSSRCAQLTSESVQDISTCLGENLQHLKTKLIDYARANLSLDKLWGWIRGIPRLKTLYAVDTNGFIKDLRAVSFLSIRGAVTFYRPSMTFMDSTEVLSQCNSTTQVLLIGNHLSINSCSDDRLLAFLGVGSRPTFHNLTRLRLKGVQYPIHILDHFTFPSLVELKISLCFTPYFKSQGVSFSTLFDNFLNRSQCRLAKFLVRDDDVAEARVLPFLGLHALKKVPEVDFDSVKIAAQGLLAINQGSCEIDAECQAQVSGLDFMAWKKTNNGKEESGYHFGWKDLQSDEKI